MKLNAAILSFTASFKIRALRYTREAAEGETFDAQASKTRQMQNEYKTNRGQFACLSKRVINEAEYLSVVPSPHPYKAPFLLVFVCVDCSLLSLASFVLA